MDTRSSGSAGGPHAASTVPGGAPRGTPRPLPTLLGGVVLLPGWATLLAVLARVTADSWSAAAATTPARPEDAVGVLAGAGALGTAAWLGAAVAASALAAGHPGGRIGSVARTVSRRLAPAMLRRAVALALGVTVLGGPAATAGVRVGPPTAVATGAQVASTLHSPAAIHSPAAVRSPTAAAAGPAPVPPAAAASTVASELAPGWTPAPSTRRVRDAGLDPGWPALGPPARASSRATAAVVVRRGDTLWDLAARRLGPGATDAEIAREWPRWYVANAAVIGSDPDHLEPGQRLFPPGVDAGGQGGDGQAAGRAVTP